MGPGLVTQRVSHFSDPAAAMSTSWNGNISQHLHGLSGNDMYHFSAKKFDLKTSKPGSSMKGQSADSEYRSDVTCAMVQVFHWQIIKMLSCVLNNFSPPFFSLFPEVGRLSHIATSPVIRVSTLSET